MQTSFKEPALSSASQAGLVNNLNDGLAVGAVPGPVRAAGLSLERIGVLAACYPPMWGVGQLVTGGLSDRWGRKWFIAGGMGVQAVGLAMIVRGCAFRLVGGGCGAARGGHGDGVPDAAGRDR